MKANVQAGPSGVARTNAGDEWDTNGSIHRPFVNTTTVGDRTFVGMNDISQYLMQKYNYNPGRYQGYSLETPSYKIMARIDWNINDNNKLNVRFTRTHSKYSSNPSSSTTPFKDSVIYPGGVDGSAGKGSSGRTSNTGLYFESSRYMQEQNFTSIAAEWNSKWGAVQCIASTYSYQDEPRTYVGGQFPDC